MSSLLLPCAQGAVCSHVIISTAVLFYKIVKDDEMAPLLLSLVTKGWVRCFSLSCLSCREWSWTRPSTSTSPSYRHLSVFLYISLFVSSLYYIYFLCWVSWQEMAPGSTIKKHNPRIAPYPLLMPAAFRSTSGDKPKHPPTMSGVLWSSVETGGSYNWGFPVNPALHMLWVTVSLTCICAYYAGKRKMTSKRLPAKGRYLPIHKKNMQSDFKCSFGLFPSGKMVWKLQYEPVSAVRAVSLGVAVGTGVNTTHLQHKVKSGSQPLSQTIFSLSLYPAGLRSSLWMVDMLSNKSWMPSPERRLCNQTQWSSHICQLEQIRVD